jgi:hypothetical protein
VYEYSTSLETFIDKLIGFMKYLLDVGAFDVKDAISLEKC